MSLHQGTMHDGAAARALTTDTMMESSERSPRAVARMDGELSEDFSLRSLSQYYHVLSFHLHPSEKKIRTLLKTRDKHTAPSASGPIRGIRSLRSSRRDRSRTVGVGKTLASGGLHHALAYVHTGMAECRKPLRNSGI